jgi:tape measure domain-containing protein
MATTMDAILRIAARVTGSGEVENLERRLKGVGPAAQSSVPSVRRLSGAVMDVAKVAAGIQLSRLAIGIEGFGRTAITAGDESIRLGFRIEALGKQFNETNKIMDLSARFADKFTYSQAEADEITAGLVGKLRQLGVQLPEIERMMFSMGQASRIIGLTTQDTTEFFRQMSQAIGQGRLNGQELVTMLERVPPFAQALVNAYNGLAKDKGIIQITKERSSEIIKQVEKGEKDQIRILQDNVRKREEMIQNEADAKLQKIRDGYDRELRLLRDKNDAELRLLQDRFDDEDRMRQRADRDARKNIFDRINSAERESLKALDREREDRERWRDHLNDINGISEDVQREIKRNDDDWWDQRERDLRARYDGERQALEDQLEDEQVARDRAIRDQREAEERSIADRLEGQEKSLTARQQAEEDAVQKAAAEQIRIIQGQLDAEVEIVKEANKKIIADTRARTIATLGDVKKMASEGFFTPDVVVRAASAEMKKLLGDMPPPTALQKWGKASKDLATTVGKDLNPALDALINTLTPLGEMFEELPQWMRVLAEVAAGAVAVGIAVKGLQAGLAGAGRMMGRGGGRPPLTPPGPKINPYQIRPPQPGAVNPWLRQMPTQPPGAFNPPFLKPSLPPLSSPPVPPAPPAGPWLKLTGILKGAADAAGSLLGRIQGIPQAVAGLGAAFASTNLAATIAGWAAVLGPSGPIAGAITGLMTWISGTALPALVGFFSGPAGWVVLAGVGITAAIIHWREPISDFLQWLGGQQETIAETFSRPLAERMAAGVSDGLLAIRNEIDFESKVWDEFFAGLYEDFSKTIDNKISQIKEKGLGETLKNDLQFESKVWDEFFLGLYTEFGKGIEEKAKGLAEGIATGFSAGGEWIKRNLNDILQLCENAINNFSSQVNNLINATNSISARIKLPPITWRLPSVNIPRLARGGWFDRSTLVEIGEGRDPQGEYAIPGSRMPQAIDAWNRGARGGALVAALQSPGLAPGRGGSGAAYSVPPASSAPPATVNLNIRPQAMIQTPGGGQWLSVEDLPAIISAAVAASRR